jgi:hypothetical protein
MQQIFGKLPDLVNNMVGNILSYALILAAISTITMTFLELFKALLKLRPKYHRKKVQRWIGNRDAYDELLVLTVTDQQASDALFDQQTDKMMGQIQAAANVIVDFPENYQRLYQFLTKIPEPYRSENKNEARIRSKREPEPSDAEIWYDFISRQDLKVEVSPSSPEVQQATRARARIDHFVARKLDAFQSQTELYWARQNQFLSVSTASVFLIALLLYIGVPVVWSVVLAIFGGMMAPFAKDVVSGLSGIRTK